MALFGALRSRIAFDLVLRQQHAYSILACADLAREQGIAEVTLSNSASRLAPAPQHLRVLEALFPPACGTPATAEARNGQLDPVI